MSSGHILVVDDEPDIRNLVKEILEDEGFEVSIAESGEAARHARRVRRPDLILLDIWMDDVDGITLLREWAEGGGLPCPVIIMSGHGTVETAVEATRLGAYDFIEKPISLAKLLLVVNRALETERLQQENLGLKRQVQPVSDPAGKSKVMQSVREQAQRIRPGVLGGRRRARRAVVVEVHDHDLILETGDGDLLLLGFAICGMDAFDQGETLLPDLLLSLDGALLYNLVFGGLVVAVMVVETPRLLVKVYSGAP